VGMLGGELPHALEVLIASGKPVALIALGNPYVLRNFAGVSAYLATFSNVPPCEVAAVRALFGEIDITGHLPVSIPGQAKYGDGIQVRATRTLTAIGPSQ
jgi:beta-N-acetylhexosaminidase